MDEKYLGKTIEVRLEAYAWTVRVDGACLRRKNGNPRLHNSPTHALQAARRAIRESRA